jgi:hypothetical protein
MGLPEVSLESFQDTEEHNVYLNWLEKDAMEMIMLEWLLLMSSPND